MEAILSMLFWIAVSGIILFFIWQAAQEVIHHTGEPLMVIPIITANATAMPEAPRRRPRRSPSAQQPKMVVTATAKVSNEPCPSEDGVQHRVRFAGRWYACQAFNSSDPRISSSMFKMGLGVVKLTDRRTHSRWIVRPLSQIQSLA